MAKSRPVSTDRTGILTPAAAKHLGNPEAANLSVVFDKVPTTVPNIPFRADNIRFNGWYIGGNITFGPDGIIEDE